VQEHDAPRIAQNAYARSVKYAGPGTAKEQSAARKQEITALQSSIANNPNVDDGGQRQTRLNQLTAQQDQHRRSKFEGRQCCQSVATAAQHRPRGRHPFS
jgi:hypothetical protein